MKMRRIKIICFLLVGAAVTLGPAVLYGASPDAELKKLHDAARAEKEVIWQFSGALKDVKPTIDAFHKKYSDVKLTTISIGAATIGGRIIIEANAGRLTLDVGTSFPVYLLPVFERDLLMRVDWGKLGVDAKKVSFDGRFIGFSDAPRVWAYNTRLIPKVEAPKTLAATLDPKWKGKIAVRAATTGFNWLFPVWKQDKQKAIEYLKGMAKQNVVPGKRDAEITNQVAGGEYPLGVLSLTSIMPALGRRAPLALCPIGPTASDLNGFWIPKGAPHPSAAKLLIAWLASPEGVKSLIKSGRGMSYPPDASPAAKLIAESGIGYVAIESEKDIREFAGPFNDAVMNILGFVPK
jgi:iron(III) transport system substrate-binding protein